MRWAVIRGAVLVAALGLAPLSQAVEILRWERLPLSVSLQVGQERVVFVDRRVRVGVPAAVGERLRVQSAGGALYLRASEALGPTRLQVQDVETGELLLLDVVASAAAAGAAPLEPLRIVSAEAATVGEMEPSPPRPTPLPVVLTRYAAQMLYAPLRTVEPLPGVARVGLREDLPLQTLLPTLPIQARALAAWRLGDHWVSAVRLSNQSARWLELDPRTLQGAFVAATFQHATLGPAGEATDTTVVYLVTRGQGLAGALLPAPVVPAQ
ncbi:TIGR03749 family integrating conjugative element protein [Pseudomonas flexibilis]|uniref:TIGR03749 family integrating conjugative element protein n=1 Tax=Pseudomonas flexibilis TaxID=706570 RepID=UPI00068B87E2|nr:TIGR03749 family integrating conjugative element protein [Pseudomonas flexibilis]SCY12178.1 integrating conjugative element protein, PFL_4704 family [Pseudomonas flexibilis]